MTRDEAHKQATKLMAQYAPSDEKLEDALTSSTQATVGAGAATIGMELVNLLTEGEALAYLAHVTGRVFGGLVWVDVSLSIYMLYRRMKRNQKGREERVIMVETPA